MKPGLDVNNPAALHEWNEQMIDRYNIIDYFNHASPIVNWIEEFRVRKILKELKTDASSHTLEVGCGAGQILLRVPQGKLHGFDLSQRLVDITRERMTKAAPDRIGTLVTGDAQAWPEAITSQHYTDIFCSEVIEHIPHPELLMREMHRATDAGTRAVIVSTPNEPLIQRFKDILIKLGIFKWIFPTLAEKMTDEWHLTSFDIPVMKKVCEGYFEIVKIQGAPFRWIPIRYIFTLKKIDRPS